jgi:hypothetical protein
MMVELTTPATLITSVLGNLAAAAEQKTGSNWVHVFQEAEGVSIRSIWAQTEYPALIRNPNVTSIIYHVVERK